MQTVGTSGAAPKTAVDVIDVHVIVRHYANFQPTNRKLIHVDEDF